MARLEDHLQNIIETNEAKIFMVKNRILVLAQYLKVKVNQNSNIEEILSKIIENIKFSFESFNDKIV